MGATRVRGRALVEDASASTSRSAWTTAVRRRTAPMILMMTVMRAMSTRTYARGRGRGRGREGDDANHAHYDDDESYEAMLSMDDGYGSGVLAEEQAAQSAGKAETEAEKKARIAAELEARGVLVGDRVRVDVRVGAPLPERSNKSSTSGVGGVGGGGGGDDATSERSSSKKRWLTRPVYGYACVVRNERVGVKRTGLMDTNESFPTYPKSWVTALDVGEMWEICTGPRNLAGASDFDMYEYKKASGELDEEDLEEEEEESPPGSMT